MQTEILIEKINGLPTEKIREVEDFVDFLKQQAVKEKNERRYQMISEYAETHAGSDADLDEELEQSSLEFLDEVEN